MEKKERDRSSLPPSSSMNSTTIRTRTLNEGLRKKKKKRSMMNNRDETYKKGTNVSRREEKEKEGEYCIIFTHQLLTPTLDVPQKVELVETVELDGDSTEIGVKLNGEKLKNIKELRCSLLASTKYLSAFVPYLSNVVKYEVSDIHIPYLLLHLDEGQSKSISSLIIKDCSENFQKISLESFPGLETLHLQWKPEKKQEAITTTTTITTILPPQKRVRQTLQVDSINLPLLSKLTLTPSSFKTWRSCLGGMKDDNVSLEYKTIIATQLKSLRISLPDESSPNTFEDSILSFKLTDILEKRLGIEGEGMEKRKKEGDNNNNNNTNYLEEGEEERSTNDALECLKGLLSMCINRQTPRVLSLDVDVSSSEITLPMLLKVLSSTRNGVTFSPLSIHIATLTDETLRSAKSLLGVGRFKGVVIHVSLVDMRANKSEFIWIEGCGHVKIIQDSE